MWLGGRHAPPSAAHTLPRGSTDGLKTGLARAKILGMRERRELSRSRLTQIVSWSSIRACTTPADGEPTCQSRPYTTALSWASPDSPIATPTGPRRERVTTATPRHTSPDIAPLSDLSNPLSGDLGSRTVGLQAVAACFPQQGSFRCIVIGCVPRRDIPLAVKCCSSRRQISFGLFDLWRHRSSSDREYDGSFKERR